MEKPGADERSAASWSHHCLYQTGGELDETCENCHKVFYYPNDPVYKMQK